MQYTKRLVTLVLAVLLAVSLFLLPSCRKPEPPAIEVKSLVWPVSVPLPEAEQFVGELPEGNTVRLAEKYNVQYLESDFKKKDGFLRSIPLLPPCRCRARWPHPCCSKGWH